VLTLKTPSNATPIKLAGPDENAAWSPGRLATISGWGSLSPTDPAQRPNHLRLANVLMQPGERCGAVWPNLFSPIDRVCAGGDTAGVGTCQGDSGGPLAVPVEVGAGLEGRLVGITSYGPLTCGTAGAPSMFTRVGADPIRAALAAGIGPHIVGATGRPVEPPRARIVKHPKRKSARRKAKFRFTANEPAVFQCKLDRHAWKACGATFAKRVGRGKHRFKLRAIDSLGQVDPTPAKWRWKVKRRR
jgi:hypothetical protein